MCHVRRRRCRRSHRYRRSHQCRRIRQCRRSRCWQSLRRRAQHSRSLGYRYCRRRPNQSRRLNPSGRRPRRRHRRSQLLCSLAVDGNLVWMAGNGGSDV